MPRQPKTETIEGIQYKVTPVGADTGTMLIFRVGRVVAGLIDGTAGFVAALRDLPPAEFAWAMGVLKETTTVGIVDVNGDGKTKFVALANIYDDHFAGNYGAWSKWALFAAEVSLGSFFGDAVAALRDRKAASTSASPTAATGGSGDSSSAPA